MPAPRHQTRFACLPQAIICRRDALLRPRHIALRLFSTSFLLILALLLTGCGGLGGEPDIMFTLPPPTATPAEPAPAIAEVSGEPDLELGATVYAMRCAMCHGPQGVGVPGLATGINLNDPATMARLSDDEIYTIVTQGRGQMVGLGDVLNETERRSVTAYVRTLADAEAAPPAPPAEAVSGVVRGEISQGTPGAGIPPDMTVSLHIFDSAFNETVLQTTADAAGQYVFDDVPVSASQVYFVSTQHQGRQFASPPVEGNPDAPETELPLLIYDVTSDPGVIRLIGNVSQMSAVGRTLEVQHIFRFENTSDQLFSSDQQLGPNRYASLEIALPVGALVVGLEGEQRFVVNADNYTLTDTRAVLPGTEHFVRLTYLLPYDDGAIIEYPVNYAASGPMRVLLQTDAIRVSGDGISDLGAETIGANTFNAFGGTLNLSPGDLVRFELRGRVPGQGASSDPSVITSDNLLLIVGGVVALVALVIGALIVITRRGAPENTTASRRDRLIEGLVQQIAELDADHEAGRINHDLYRRQRAQFKARLAELMDENSGNTAT